MCSSVLRNIYFFGNDLALFSFGDFKIWTLHLNKFSNFMMTFHWFYFLNYFLMYLICWDIFTFLSFVISRSSFLFSESLCFCSCLFLLHRHNVFPLMILIFFRSSSTYVLFLSPLSLSLLPGVTLRMNAVLTCCLLAWEVWYWLVALLYSEQVDMAI